MNLELITQYGLQGLVLVFGHGLGLVLYCRIWRRHIGMWLESAKSSLRTNAGGVESA